MDVYLSYTNTTAFLFFRQVTLIVLTPHCFDEYFLKFNFFDGPCFTASLSKGLGLAIILGSLMVKLPQIVKIVNSKSAEGISAVSVTLDLVAITIYASYSFVKQFPFTSWGDSSFLAIQTVIIGFLIFYYEGQTLQAVLYVISYLAVCFVLMSGITSVDFLWTMQGFNIPILLSGKLAQAYTNWSNGHTGQLSAVTCLMLFFGSLARIFTSFQETGDAMVIITYIFSTFANLVIVTQLILYWNVDMNKKKKRKTQ